jgi:transporter family protein
LLSAVFAAMTAIFAKIGLTGVDSDLATLVRTGIIAVVLAAFVIATGKWANPLTLPTKTLLFLLLSGLATGASWVCYFRALKVGEASKVAPVDKLSLVLVAVFAVLFLDNQHRLLSLDTLFTGTVSQTSVYPREVVKRALARNAAAVILAHNHPSGVAEPSRADEYLTQALKSALALVDVRVLDHMVVGCGVVVSFSERGLL